MHPSSSPHPAGAAFVFLAPPLRATHESHPRDDGSCRRGEGIKGSARLNEELKCVADDLVLAVANRDGEPDAALLVAAAAGERDAVLLLLDEAVDRDAHLELL